MCNLVNWNCESSITLGWYETFVFVLKFGSFLAVGILGLGHCTKKLKQRIPALLMGSGISIIVVLLLLYFKRSSYMILLNMI